jgi:hypothetical protein
LPMF